MGKKEAFPKRLTMMLVRNIIHLPRIGTKIFRYAKAENLEESVKYELIREIGHRGCTSGNVTVHGYGFDQLPEQSGYIMYPNHQGLFDVLGLVYLDPHPFGVVIKKEAEKVFVLRQLIQILGGLFMDREDPKQSLQIINEVARQVKEGRNFLIFPEGTRSKNGNHLGTFKSGSFKAATKAKCPIVPIAIIDSFLPFDNPSTEQVDVQIHVLPPILYEEYQGMKTVDIAQMVKERIEQVIAGHEHNFDNHREC